MNSDGRRNQKKEKAKKRRKERKRKYRSKEERVKKEVGQKYLDESKTRAGKKYTKYTQYIHTCIYTHIPLLRAAVVAYTHIHIMHACIHIKIKQAMYRKYIDWKTC